MAPSGSPGSSGLIPIMPCPKSCPGTVQVLSLLHVHHRDPFHASLTFTDLSLAERYKVPLSPRYPVFPSLNRRSPSFGSPLSFTALSLVLFSSGLLVSTIPSFLLSRLPTSWPQKRARLISSRIPISNQTVPKLICSSSTNMAFDQRNRTPSVRHSASPVVNQSKAPTT